MVSALVLRNAAAWALPRPSAMASAKLAKRTVNHSHAATSPANRLSSGLASLRSWKKIRVVKTSSNEDHEHDGVASLNPGIELAEAVDDRLSHDGGLEQRPLPGPATVGRGFRCCLGLQCSRLLLEGKVFDDRAQRQRREEGEAADDEDDSDYEADEERGVSRAEPGGGRHDLLSGQRPGDTEDRDDQEETADQHGHSEGRVHPVGPR